MNQADNLEPLSRCAGFGGWRFHASVIAVLALIGVIEMPYVEFLEDIPSTQWTAKSIHDVPANLATAFIDGKQARASTEVQAALAGMQKQNEDFQRGLLEKVQERVRPTSTMTTRKPPDGGGGVNFGKVNQGEFTSTAPGEGDDDKRCLADAMRCIFLVNCRDADPALHKFARNRLRGYSDEYTEYNFDETTGEFSQMITRQLAGGGLEQIKRTGTDSISGGATYGFTLKPNYIGNLFRIAREGEVFASATRKIPVTQGNEVIWPNLNQFRAPSILNGIPQAAVFGGITLSYVGETTARISSDGAVEENRYKVVDLTGMTDFSRDYIVDNYIAMDMEITRMFGEAIAWIEDWVTIRGDGIAKPQGFFNANATIIGGPTNNNRGTANHIEYEDIVWMMSRLSPQCWPNARWLTNVTCVPDLVAIKNHAGNYVYQPNSLISQAMRPSVQGDLPYTEADMVMRPMGSLEGFPVYFTEKASILGTLGDINLVCPYQYGLAERSGVEVGVSDQFYFSTDRIAYRFKKRHFGKSLWPAAYTQADNPTTPSSGTTVSPFVQLQHL